MEYAELVGVYERLADTDSNNEKRDILAETFAEAGDLLPLVVKLVRGRLFAAHQREELGVSSSLTLDAISKSTGVSESALREQWRETGDLGDVAAWAVDNQTQQTLFSESLTVERVHDSIREIASFEGDGSQQRRVDEIAGLLADADPEEARYIVRTALGHMRVGIGEGTIRDAIAVAFLDGSDAAVDAVERAYQVTNDYRVVAETAREEGRDGLEQLDVELFRPVQVMLAEKGESLGEALADAAPDGTAVAEVKYDGARVQIHKHGDEIRLFTRRLEDITEQFPDVVAAVREGVTAESAILDGELVGYTPETVEGDDRDPVPFQRFSQRIKREDGVESMAREVPVVAHLFDCLYDGETLIERPFETRIERLEASFEDVSVRPDEPRAGLEHSRTVRAEVDPQADDEADPPEAVTDLYREALDAGHEGLMIKNPTATYQPGTRVGRMLKVKPTMEPLDLVVSRAIYSEGRRSDWLGRLYLACYDDDAEEFREVGRLSTGYTDEELEELTDRLEELIVSRDGRAVELRPEVVLEVEYEEIQRSEEYDSGYALRFPRFLRRRETLDPTDADSLARVERLYDEQ
ncbi:ATP-dependent DNA ligase [Halovenus sp. WSH3]|uniref:DNA ligase n=1 Tax=Halovenus carboxidivorans TaxID=2692199 RepID=A0A6B0SZR3_9EURY|nr:ATP-dependent DNA ligase [Halovenus carboxidivorans]MXR51015.1 ATP-dependent DNA ligase [Halovenus carboxidivorans]